MLLIYRTSVIQPKNKYTMHMQLPKSSQNLDQGARRNSRRDSRRVRMSREMREWQFKMANPFRNAEQQNCFPPTVLSQIQQLEYISSKSIKNIELPQCRRTSNFVKNLQMMQQLAKKQEQKYTGMLREGSKAPNPKNPNSNQSPSDLLPINMNEDDQVSLELNGFYDYRERVEDDFNLFDNQDSCMRDEGQPAFYSNQEIEMCMMDQEVNNYLQ